GAREEGASGAGDHHRLDRRIVAGLSQCLGEPGADLVLERVNRWVVDGDDRYLAVPTEIDAGVDIAHLHLPSCRKYESRPIRSVDEGLECGESGPVCGLTRKVRVGRLPASRCREPDGARSARNGGAAGGPRPETR